MLKPIVVVMAVALAGTASAAGWRSLRVDGSSEEAFARSMAEFKEELSSAREFVFGQALEDIWTQGEKAAAVEQRQYTADEFYRQLDGLQYEDIVKYTDPTGDTAKRRYQDYYPVTRDPFPRILHPMTDPGARHQIGTPNGFPP